ncbi:MAG: aminopeptidase, partial [Anaerolineales bacterium]|nr:aminopeptidase [Anaerolineales bacterium]
MADPRVSKLARLLVNYCVATRPGDKIILAGTSSALPLVTETYRAILQAGGHPFLLWRDQEFTEILLQQANDQQLAF